jgi:hypothetical protein
LPAIGLVIFCQALTAIAGCAKELERGAILTLDWSDKARARLLPLR